MIYIKDRYLDSALTKNEDVWTINEVDFVIIFIFENTPAEKRAKLAVRSSKLFPTNYS